MHQEVVEAEGHLIDSHLMERIFDTVVEYNGRFEVVYAPVLIDEPMLRAVITGHDAHPRTGGDIKGGRLDARLPKVSASALGLAA